MKVIRHISGCIALVMILLAGSALHLSAQPSNDMPCSAVELEISDSCDFSEYTNIDASDSGLPDPGCAFYAGGDIWFLVIVPADSSFEIQTDTEAEAQFPLNNGWMFRGAMALYEGSCDTLTPMGCYENNSSYHPRMAGAVLSGQNPGDTIWVRIWENSNNDNGKLNICVTPLVEVEEACPGVFDVSGGGSYCQGDTGVSVTLPGSEPGMQYTLLLNDTVRMDTLAGNGSSLAWSPVTGVGIYKIEGENPADSCIIMMNDSALVTVLAVPQLTPDEVSITCFEDDDGSISLEVIAEPPFVVEWTGPSGYLSNKQNLTDLSPGDYTATVTDNNSCVTVSPAITITEPALLVATVEEVAHLTNYEDGDGSIDLSITGGTKPYFVSWTGTDDYISSDKDPSEMTVGYYDVMVTDNHLCMDSVQMIRITLNEDPDRVFIPEGFSPNGDGYNDRFVILGIEYFQDNELMVFNRQGVTVLHRLNYENDWDGGPEKGGVLGGELPEGTYYYIFKYGGSSVRKGYVYINRE